MLQDDNRYYLRGVVSAALSTPDKKCDVEKYFVFTDAAMFTDWIRTFL